VAGGKARALKIDVSGSGHPPNGRGDGEGFRTNRYSG
jgi:hypothetical protein